jgi:hypothetical protein
MMAAASVPLTHVPPGTASVIKTDDPWQTESGPDIAATGLTVTSAVAVHPSAMVYVIMTVPFNKPVTTPEDETEAALPLVAQVPGPVASLRSDVAPWHNIVVPVITAAGVRTVTVAEAIQPAAMEYVIIVVPVVSPQIIPLDDPMVAVPVLVLVHEPPPTASVSV